MKLFKKWYFWVLVIIVVAVMALSGGGDSTPTVKQNKETISKAEFDQLKEGMTYEEVTTIIGGSGEVMSESGNTTVYMYEGEGQLGANANIMIQDGKMISKAQFGLK